MRTLAVLTLIAVAACGGNDGYTGTLAPLPAVGLERAVVLVEATQHVAHVVDVGADGSLTLRSQALGAQPVLVQERLGMGHDEALVLSRGERGDTGVAPQPARLAIVPGDARTAPREYALGNPFNALAQSPDGNTGLVFFVAGSGASRLLYNPNEIALVDLASPPSDDVAAPNPVKRTVRSFGGVPTGALFATVDVAGAPRSLVIVLSDSYVTLLDLDHPTRTEISVPLTLASATRDVAPAQVVVDSADATIYLRADASDDVYAVHLDAATPATPLDNDFTPSLTQLAVGARPADMLLYQETDGPRLLVLTRSGSLAVIDAHSSLVTAVALAAPADHLLGFDAPAPGDATIRPRALAYATVGYSSRVTFVDLIGLASRGTRNLDVRTAARPVIGALPVPSRGVALLVHQSAPGDPGVSILDLAQRTAAPINADVSLAAAAFGAGERRLWVAPPTGTRVGWLDIDSLTPGEVRLDAPATDIVPLPTIGRVAVIQNSPFGALTVIDEADPARATAHYIDGILLDGLFARGGV